jgi:hypothetical protein
MNEMQSCSSSCYEMWTAHEAVAHVYMLCVVYIVYMLCVVYIVYMLCVVYIVYMLCVACSWTASVRDVERFAQACGAQLSALNKVHGRGVGRYCHGVVRYPSAQHPASLG